MVRPERFELPTCCSGGNRSIQLSYGRARMFTVYMGKGNGFNVVVARAGKRSNIYSCQLKTERTSHTRGKCRQRSIVVKMKLRLTAARFD